MVEEGIKMIKEDAKNIAEFRGFHSGITTFLIGTKEINRIQFDLPTLYDDWNCYRGNKNKSFSRFLNIYRSDLFLIIALENAILSLNERDVKKLVYSEPLEDWQKKNILLKSEKPAYHLVNLTTFLYMNYERFLLCLQALFSSQDKEKFEDKKRSIIKKMKEEKIDDKLVKLIESIDVSKIRKYRTNIMHLNGIFFEEFFPSGGKNLKFDDYLIDIRKEISIFYEILYNFVLFSTGKEPKYMFIQPNKEEDVMKLLKKKALFKRFDSFASSLSEFDRIAIIFHTDADGITAGVIASKAAERISGKKPALFLTPAPSEVIISKKMIAELKKKKINKVVVVDLNVDQDPKSIKALEKFAEILILDHHTIQNDVNSAKTVMIKPQNFSKINPSKYAASKLVYDMFLRCADLSDLAWLAVIGIYGDMAESEWASFISATFRKDKITANGIRKAGALIVYARSFDEKNGPMKAFKAFYSAKSISEVLESSLSKYAEKIESELAQYIKKRKELAQFYSEKKLLVYEISPKYNIKSELVNRLSRGFYPDMTCIVIQKKGKTASIGARNQTGAVSMNDLMIRATKGIPESSGGGHVQAAGASVPNKKRYIDGFLVALKGAL